MDTEQKLKSVEDQVELLIRRQVNSIKCPYCDGRAAVQDGKPLCCERLARAVDEVLAKRHAVQIGEAKIQIVEERIRELEATGESKEFKCPYCDALTKIADGEKFCCKTFYMAWQVVAERLKQEKETRLFNEIAERLYKGIQESGSNPLVSLN
jgi:uncharacterized Zn-finger protein